MVPHSDNIGIIWLNTTMGLVNPPEWKMLHKIWNLIYLHNIFGGRPFHPFVPSSASSSIHPSSSSPKKKVMEEEEEGGGRMAAAVDPNVHVIQSCSL
jgi:hypothetical protein